MSTDETAAERPRRYRASPKRSATHAENARKIEEAAWIVFSTIGLDRASIRDIVVMSGVSAGTFYNYFRTKEAVFDLLMGRLLGEIRTLTGKARDDAADLESMLAHCYDVYLDFLATREGARRFCELNQHHIRSRLFGAETMAGLVGDIGRDLDRVMPGARLGPEERTLMASMIVATASEVLFLSEGAAMGSAGLGAFLTRLMVGGLRSWLPMTPQKE